ncbi:MAG: carbon-nitrogen hydrolase family protein [Verrucomicrobiota bacterium]
MRAYLALRLVLMAAVCLQAKGAPATVRLKVAAVQMAIAGSIEVNRDRIVSGISEAAARGARMVVFPEAALDGRGNDDPAAVEQAIASIRRAAEAQNIYVLFGGTTQSKALKKEVNYAHGVGPDGRDLFHNEKLYDNHRAAMPGVFHVDGIPCSAMICADRWLRGAEEIPIQLGAQVSFELSCNYACEWVPPFEWYWYAPRALRNKVFVVFVNSGNQVAGKTDPDGPGRLHHGHSAVFDPSGRVVAAARDDAQQIVLAEIELNHATRSEAIARAENPVLRAFWETGLKLQRGEKIKVPPVTPLKSPETEITLAVAQVIHDAARMEAMIREARQKGADLIAFPAQAARDEATLKRLQQAARENQITVVCGMAQRADRGLHNSAFVFGPDGALLTRYDQISAWGSSYKSGTNAAAMWFTVKGVPAIVLIERDGVWSEMAELAAAAGAQIIVHVHHDLVTTPESRLMRLQLAANLASYKTFTAVASPTDSMLWDDLRGMDESRAVVRNLPQPDSGPVEVYSPFSANLIARAGAGGPLLVATRKIPAVNPHHPRRTSGLNPQMEAWYAVGASLIRPAQK